MPSTTRVSTLPSRWPARPASDPLKPPRSWARGIGSSPPIRIRASSAPSYQLAVSEKGVDTALFLAAQQVVDGTFEGGEKSLGLAEDGVGLGHPHESVPQEVLDTVAAYEQAIIDGTITVPADEEELAAFEPVALEAIGAPVATPTA